MDDKKENKEEIGEIFKDEIDELKENLERKEYLLQAAEQRYFQFEKILLQASETDTDIRKKVSDMNILLRDRKISNVVEENYQMRQENKELAYKVGSLQDQLETLQQNGEIEDVNELSCFQTKNPHKMPKLDLGKLRKAEVDQTPYIKKLE